MRTNKRAKIQAPVVLSANVARRGLPNVEPSLESKPAAGRRSSQSQRLLLKPLDLELGVNQPCVKQGARGANQIPSRTRTALPIAISIPG
jgi:hypothetical protein